MTILRALNHAKTARFANPRIFLSSSSSESSTPPPATLSQQGNLKKLPLPELHETLPKWLLTAKPHLNDREWQVTRKKAEAFMTRALPMQDYLRKKVKATDNWFADWWLDMAYLGFRTCLPVHSSPGIIMPPQAFGSSNEKWLSYAAKLVQAVLQYKSRLDMGLIPVEMSGSLPMDMIQYTRLFGATRIPGAEKDGQIFAGDSDYILVAHNGNFFTMTVKDANGNFLEASQLLSGLQEILAESTRSGKRGMIGVLTSDSRDNWHQAYQLLKANHSAHVEAIEKSLFILCLDDEIEGHDDQLTRTALNCLHGLGSKINGNNRWYDKALQFIVSKSGEIGVCNEHSFAEAVPTMNIVDFILDQINTMEDNSIQSLETPFVQHLDFQDSNGFDAMLETAASNLDTLVNDLDMQVLDFQDFGKEAIKKLKLSPDSFVQMAIQLSFFKMHSTPGATYESAATRIFKEGRTEVIRSCSLESVEFVQTMQNPNKSLTAKKETLMKAMQSHNNYAKSAVQGYGVDRHFQGLKMAAIELGKPVPDLYQDLGYTRSSRMRLSTSQISSRHLSGCCYGPLEPDGYGTSYSIGGNNLLFSCSSMRSNGSTNAKEFAFQLSNSLHDMHDLCMASKAKL